MYPSAREVRTRSPRRRHPPRGRAHACIRAHTHAWTYTYMCTYTVAAASAPSSRTCTIVASLEGEKAPREHATPRVRSRHPLATSSHSCKLSLCSPALARLPGCCCCPPRSASWAALLSGCRWSSCAAAGSGGAATFAADFCCSVLGSSSSLMVQSITSAPVVLLSNDEDEDAPRPKRPRAVPLRGRLGLGASSSSSLLKRTTGSADEPACAAIFLRVSDGLAGDDPLGETPVGLRVHMLVRAKPEEEQERGRRAEKRALREGRQ